MSAGKILRSENIPTWCRNSRRAGSRRRCYSFVGVNMEEHILAKPLRTLTVLSSIFVIALSEQPMQAQDRDKLKIGFSIEAMKGERWQTDLNSFVVRAKQLGAEVISGDANG